MKEAEVIGGVGLCTRRWFELQRAGERRTITTATPVEILSGAAV